MTKQYEYEVMDRINSVFLIDMIAELEAQKAFYHRTVNVLGAGDLQIIWLDITSYHIDGLIGQYKELLELKEKYVKTV
jgi:hypothetical protein